MTCSDTDFDTSNRHVADFERLMRRRGGDWGDFKYRFTLSENEEHSAQILCQQYKFDFAEEWRGFNDLFQPTQANSPAQCAAEARWFPTRTTKPANAFRQWLHTRHLMQQGVTPQT